MAIANQINGLNGVPRAIREYYQSVGLPNVIVSCIDRDSVREDRTRYISILFKDTPYRHRWNDTNKAGKFAKFKAGEWTLEEIPL